MCLPCIGRTPLRLHGVPLLVLRIILVNCMNIQWLKLHESLAAHSSPNEPYSKRVYANALTLTIALDAGTSRL